MSETWVQALNQGDPLEKEMANHSSILAWKIPWTEPSWQEPGSSVLASYSPWGHRRVRYDLVTKLT